jgi:hypothetical protein
MEANVATQSIERSNHASGVRHQSRRRRSPPSSPSRSKGQKKDPSVDTPTR